MPTDISSSPSPQSPQQFVAGVRERVAKIVVGQDVVVERVMIALLTGGHLLLRGLAKTLLLKGRCRYPDFMNGIGVAGTCAV